MSGYRLFFHMSFLWTCSGCFENWNSCRKVHLLQEKVCGVYPQMD